MNIAIVVAAGSGKRFGAEKPKQFLEICGKPLLIHTLQKFSDCPAIDEIILVLAAEEIENFQPILAKYNFNKSIKLISGGQTRAASVFNGLKSIDSLKAKIVAVHDGARPLVTIEEITRTIETAKVSGAACLTAAVTDTIKEISGGKIVRTIDRSKLRRALTPQAFRFEIIKRAFENVDLSEAATDECFLVEKLGIEISAVEGSAENIKITTPEDLIFAENILRKTQKI